MSWNIYTYARVNEVADLISQARARDDDDPRLMLVLGWIMSGEWEPALDLHIRDGVPTLEPGRAAREYLARSNAGRA